MQIDLNLKCGGKVTRVEVLKDGKISRTIQMNSPNHIVKGGRDYLCTWRGSNQMPYIGLWTTNGATAYAGCYESASSLNMLYGFPNVCNDFTYFQYSGDTYEDSTQFPYNNRQGQIGPLTFGKIGTSAKPTGDTDTDLDAPISDVAIDNYRNGCAGWHATCLREDNSLTIRTAYVFSIQSACTIREFGTFGMYAPASTNLTTSNYNQVSLYDHQRMFTRTVLTHPIEAKAGEEVGIIYEFTIQFPTKEEVATTFAGFNCVRSFHLPPKNAASVLGRWYPLNANNDNLPIGFFSTRNHSISSGNFSKSNNNVSNTIENSSCFPLCALRFCAKTSRATDYNQNYTRVINSSSALGMSPIAYIEDCQGSYNNWYRQSLLYTNAQGKLRNMLADATDYIHTMEDYIPGTGYRIHNITLSSLKTNRPTIYGIGLLGFIYRFGHYENGSFITEPISIPAGYSISYKIKLIISNLNDDGDEGSDEGSGS